MRRIAFINEKGGTCKTTLAVNTAAYFAAKKNQRVLLIDLDTQGHAGKALGVNVRQVSKNIFHWLTEADITLNDVRHGTQVPGLDVVPSYKEMAEFPLAVAQAPRRENLLLERMKEARDYDVVIFDAPPSLGLATTNILVAATEVVIPVATTYLSLDGCAEMTETIERVSQKHRSSALPISLVVPTLYRKTALADEVVSKLQKYFPGRVARSPLAFNVAIDEAQSHGKTIWEHAPWSRGATMLQSIADDLDRAQITE
jgi:chromosome partitioning protein